MSMLVNGGITKDYMVEMGLRYGDPLSYFLCVLDIEVLNWSGE